MSLPASKVMPLWQPSLFRRLSSVRAKRATRRRMPLSFCLAGHPFAAVHPATSPSTLPHRKERLRANFFQLIVLKSWW
jgi:hypothetical protein